jgi:alkylation response protein AidB-like acyl-CoA dehydrogenase
LSPEQEIVMTVVRDHPATVPEAVAGLSEAAAAYRDHGERHGTLHPAVWRALEASAVPRAALPACCGGLEWPAPQILDAVRQVALADPAAGWVAAICGPAGAFLSRLDP